VALAAGATLQLARRVQLQAGYDHKFRAGGSFDDDALVVDLTVMR
jgi:hypothetical protein